MNENEKPDPRTERPQPERGDLHQLLNAITEAADDFTDAWSAFLADFLGGLQEPEGAGRPPAPEDAAPDRQQAFSRITRRSRRPLPPLTTTRRHCPPLNVVPYDSARNQKERKQKENPT